MTIRLEKFACVRRKLLLSGVVVLGLAGPGTSAAQTSGVAKAAALCPHDPRCNLLTAFFDRYGGRLHKFVPDFLAAADRNRLDWRLLPGLSTMETTAGKHAQNSNVFGWASGRTNFRSIQHAIDFVADRLANSSTYRGKDVVGKLRTYNPAHTAYPGRVLKYMRELCTDEEAAALTPQAGAEAVGGAN